jgi:hypothetical protein
MIIDIYIFLEILMVITFATAFFTKQEIIWALSIVLSGILAVTSYSIEYYVYQYNATAGYYSPVIISQSYPYMMGINILFLILGLVLSIYDIFDKYGSNFVGK